MAVTYAFRGEVLEIRATGTYASREMEHVFRAALDDPARPLLRALLYDARESAVVASRTTPEVREAVAFFQGLARQCGQRIALVAATDAAYGVMRMVAGWAEGQDIDAAVFRDADDAIAWARR